MFGSFEITSIRLYTPLRNPRMYNLIDAISSRTKQKWRSMFKYINDYMFLIPCCGVRYDFCKKLCSVRFCLLLFGGGLMFYLRCLCLFCIKWFPTHIWITWWMSYNMQELIALRVCLGSFPVFGVVQGAYHLSFLDCVFVCLSFNRNGNGRFGSVKSKSSYHFFGNACTKLGPLRFYQFSPVVDWFCLFFPFGRLLGVR